MAATTEQKPHACTETGCDYRAKTPGAITQHVKREHAVDPLAATRATMGSSAPRPGAVVEKRKLTVAPSGIPSVDFAIGVGGVPDDAILEVYGPPASGKTFMAMVFAAYAQSKGRRAGYMDAEKAMQNTFLDLIPGLDVGALEYGMPPDFRDEEDPAIRKKMEAEGFDGSGEAALEASRRMIQSGAMDIWIVDSVRACTPRICMQKNIGDSATRAALATLFGEALRILAKDCQQNKCLGIFVNHMTTLPSAGFGKDWSKPATGPFDYYASLQLQVKRTFVYKDKSGRRIGHRVKVMVDKSKVAAPHASAEFDLYYADTVAVAHENARLKERQVVPGVDLASSWLSVLKESGAIHWAGSAWVDLRTGEKYGSEQAVREIVSDPTSELSAAAREIVYPPEFAAA